jgi:hypothetical protein
VSDKEAGNFSFVKFGELLNDFLTVRFETGEAASESGKHPNVKKKDVVRASRRRGVFLLRDINHRQHGESGLFYEAEQ